MKLETWCMKAGVQLINCGKGHLKIVGVNTVNYYPESRRRTAFVVAPDGSSTTHRFVNNKRAVELAGGPKPAPVQQRDPVQSLGPWPELMAAARRMKEKLFGANI